MTAWVDRIGDVERAPLAPLGGGAIFQTPGGGVLEERGGDQAGSLVDAPRRQGRGGVGQVQGREQLPHLSERRRQRDWLQGSLHDWSVPQASQLPTAGQWPSWAQEGEEGQVMYMLRGAT